jgi:hypothetical protein
MKIEVGVLIAIIGILLTYLAFSRNRDKDIKSDATEAAIISTKLDIITTGIDNIRIDIKANEKKVSDLNERTIRIEESCKQAHLRINRLEEKEV